MKLVLEAKDGHRMGELDIENSRWEQIADHFENVSDFVIDVKRPGEVGDFYIEAGNQHIGNDEVSGLPRHMDVGESVFFKAWSMKLSYYERHTADDFIGGASKGIEFGKGLMGELRTRADRVWVAIMDDRDDLRQASSELLDIVYDVLAVNSR